MNSKVRLWINLIAIIIALAFIAIAVVAILRKSPTFLSQPGLDNQVKDLNMNISGKINDVEVFDVKFINGQPNKQIENIRLKEADTTFTVEQNTLIYTLTFENNSNGIIYITVSGIYVDELERFTTNAVVSIKGMQTLYGNDNFQPLPPITFEIPKLENNELSIAEITLTYSLIAFNRKVNNATQNLLITISDKANT